MAQIVEGWSNNPKVVGSSPNAVEVFRLRLLAPAWCNTYFRIVFLYAQTSLQLDKAVAAELKADAKASANAKAALGANIKALEGLVGAALGVQASAGKSVISLSQ